MTLLDRCIRRRTFLRGTLGAAVGVTCALLVGVNPLKGTGRVAAQEEAVKRRLDCSSCRASVDTRAGYVVCESCGGFTCPRCARRREGGFSCLSCWHGG